MTAKTTLHIVVLLLAGGVLAGGCVVHRSIDPALIDQYQRHVIAAGPQIRLLGDLTRQAPTSTGPPLKAMADDKTGRRRIELDLREAVRRTLRNNPRITVVAYDPAIAREEIIQAEAVFDAVIFAKVASDRGDSPIRSSFEATRSKAVSYQAGARKLMTTGGAVEVTYDFSRQWEDTVSFGELNPTYRHSLAAKMTQPLLRNAWPDVVTSQIRIARLSRDSSAEAFRAAVLDAIRDVQELYWQLGLARLDLEIQQDLLDETVQVYERIKARGQLDATRIQITRTEAAVAAREAGLIAAAKVILDVQDQLITKMADASATLRGNVDIIPVTPPLDSELLVETTGQVAAALKYSPELAQARKAIRINDINVTVARNQTLARLDLTAEAKLNGLTGDEDFYEKDGSWKDSWGQMWGMNYIEYNLALSFEWPLGNREPAAALRRARYQREKSVAALQDAVDQVASFVREAIRQIDSSYRQLAANRKALEAAKGNLQALRDRGENLQALTPEFLELILSAQEGVASARRSVLQATVDYNVAQTRLSRVTGTALNEMGVTIADPGDNVADIIARGATLTGENRPRPDGPQAP